MSDKKKILIVGHIGHSQSSMSATVAQIIASKGMHDVQVVDLSEPDKQRGINITHSIDDIALLAGRDFGKSKKLLKEIELPEPPKMYQTIDSEFTGTSNRAEKRKGKFKRYK